jgi:hypothetical protein
VIFITKKRLLMQLRLAITPNLFYDPKYQGAELPWR